MSDVIDGNAIARAPDPRDGKRGWAYMDVLLDEYPKVKGFDPTHPDRMRVEITMRRQRERILALERS
ncbi:hypothetical protein LCGC14_0898480 [marine sediment metagenome]|uniref:Uncharacterized protein n=1 Tax=marine sediment metagenome TaxID=412755 RepID=A0A0F9PHU7_9ZZZZ